jgi:hypothetical protein
VRSPKWLTSGVVPPVLDIDAMRMVLNRQLPIKCVDIWENDGI